VRSRQGLDVPDVVQTGRAHLPEVIFNDPGLPMIFQYAQGFLSILHLPKGVLIDDGIISCVLEDARRYPRLGRIE
jgi:hypothetical protein